MRNKSAIKNVGVRRFVELKQKMVMGSAPNFVSQDC